MNLKFDPVDVVGAGCGVAIARVFRLFATIFMGCGIASWSIHTTRMFGEPWEPFVYFISGPVHLLSIWICFSLPTLIEGIIMIVRSDEPVGLRDVVFATILGLWCMLGYRSEMKSPALSWTLWIILSAMLATATWFWSQWSRNRWMQEIAELKAENDLRRQELQEKFGTVAPNMYSNDET